MSSHNDLFIASGNSPTQPDFVVENHGSIFLLKPRTPAARFWIEQHIEQTGWQPYFPTIVIEHRFVTDIVRAAQADGLVVV